MKRSQKTLFALLVAAVGLSACSSLQPKPQVAQSNLPRDLSPQVPAPDRIELVSGNNEFALALYHQISSGDANLFYSPYSISIALAMTYAGARGQTADQMAQAMHFTLPEARLHPAFNRLALELDGRSKVEGLDPNQAFQLSVANSLWGQSGFHFEQVFLDTLARNYDAGMRLVDYRKDAEAARQTINDWVNQSTQGKIKDIIPKGALDELTRLVLANAVYFKATWQHPFEPNATQPGSFHLRDGTSIEVPMMREEADRRSLQGDGYRAVELSYVGGQLSMLVLLPDEGRLGDIESRLNAGLVDATVAALQSGEVILTMPKFKFEWSTGLVDGLKALSMEDAFDRDQADFAGMDGARDLYICDVLHKAFISVDEQGTEAAAATVVIVSATSMPTNVTEIEIDRPFFFLIRDNPTGTILFVGRVMNPAAS
jgi:serpin B